MKGRVIEAAIAKQDGTIGFLDNVASNVGLINPQGRSVVSISMNSILDTIPQRRVDLLKIDIEGYERELFEGESAWLTHVRAIIVEFHYSRAENDKMIAFLISRGYRYFAPQNRDPSASHGSDFFLRMDKETR